MILFTRREFFLPVNRAKVIGARLQRKIPREKGEINPFATMVA